MSSALPLPTDAERSRDAPRDADRTAAAALRHRTDIEGLRGVAVLSVLAVHSFPHWLQGGFIGVDIFFVLSGYLISLLLFQAHDAGRFSLVDFYVRRIRRLYPALCLVLLACLVFSVAFAFPSASRQVGLHVAAGAMFLSNIALWSESGYFDAASQAKPLLHLWSLGIEEQFYLAWPLVALFLFRHRRWALWLIGGAALASWGLNLALVIDRPVATFFLLPTRCWELMLGALLAWLTRYVDGGPVPWLRQRLPDRSWSCRNASDGCAWLGLLMLLSALCLIDKSDPFPGWRALLPTLGTFALLAAGPDAWVNRQLLSHPILRFYGQISYPLYLWHWPLLSFPVVMGVPLTTEARVLILVTSVVLATLTFEWIEKPVRRGIGGSRLTWMLVTSLALLGVCGAVVKRTDGLLNTYPDRLQELAATEFRFNYSAYRLRRCMLDLEQGPGSFAAECVDRRDDTRPLVWLWGDSHAAALYPGLSTLAIGEQGSTLRLAQFTAAQCPPLMTPPPHSSAPCERINADVLARIRTERPHTVVLAGNWLRYGSSATGIDATAEGLRQTVRALTAMGVARVIVYGQMPIWTVPPPRLALLAWRHSSVVPQRDDEHLDPAARAIDPVISAALAPTDGVFVAPMKHLCDASGCLLTASDDTSELPVAFDESHLTDAGSRVLAERSHADWPP